MRGIVGAALDGEGPGPGARAQAPPPFDGRGILEDTAGAVAAAARGFAEFAEVEPRAPPGDHRGHAARRARQRRAAVADGRRGDRPRPFRRQGPQEHARRHTHARARRPRARRFFGGPRPHHRGESAVRRHRFHHPVHEPDRDGHQQRHLHGRRRQHGRLQSASVGARRHTHRDRHPEPRDRGGRRPARAPLRRVVPVDRDRPGAHVAPGRPASRRDGRSGGRARRDALGQEGHRSRSGQPAGRRRRERRHREGRPRHHRRREPRQQHRLHRREGDHRGEKHRGRPQGGAHRRRAPWRSAVRPSSV